MYEIKEASSQVARHNQRGFTRTELLLVLAMCCVLLPLLTVASQRSDEDINRLQCRNNLRQIGAWLTMYAEDHNDALPRNSGGWAIDLSHDLIASAVSYHLEVDALYCPSGAALAVDDRFKFFPSFAQLDYVLTLRGLNGGLSSSNLNTSIVPQPVYWSDGTLLYLHKAEERELAVDSTLSNGRDRQTANFTQIWGAAPAPYRSNHLNGQVPAGGNVLYLDGHVEWRRFNEMVVRSNGSPTFWY